MWRGNSPSSLPSKFSVCSPDYIKAYDHPISIPSLSHLVKEMNITIFERPLLPSYIYPCSVEDIHSSLARLPEIDLQGLAAVGLVSVTRKDSAYARYFSKPKPVIHLHSFPDTLTYKQPPNTKRSDIELGLADALSYGMRVEEVGSRWICYWAIEDLKRFYVDHVLLHEVGHHVYHQQRECAGLENKIKTRTKEQFAEDYAIRHQRR